MSRATEQVTIEHGGGAAAAGASGVHILLLQMVQQQPAVGVVLCHVHAVLAEEVRNNFVAQGPQVSGEYQVVVRRGGAGGLCHRG